MRAIAINALIIIVLAVSVLISTVAFYYPTFIGSEKTVSTRSTLDRACATLLNSNCVLQTQKIQTVGFDADKDGNVSESAANGDNLFMLCRYHYQTGCTGRIDGDINSDCIVENIDYNAFVAAYMSTCNETTCMSGSCWGDYSACTASAKWNPFADFDKNGRIDVFDFMLFAGYYGKTEPTAERECKKLCGC